MDTPEMDTPQNSRSVDAPSSSRKSGFPDTPSTVLSAHLDDAALSAWHLIAGDHDLNIITVFAGIPGSDLITELDRSHGATNSADWVKLRRSEDLAVMSRVGRRPTHLDLLDAGYRAYDAPDIRLALENRTGDNGTDSFAKLIEDEPSLRLGSDVISNACRGHIPDHSHVFAPVGIGGHPDHRELAVFALELVKKGHRVSLYADSPYYLRHGLPSLLGGRSRGAADAQITDAFEAIGLSASDFPATTVDLPRRATERKIAALRAYTTEFDQLNTSFEGILGNIHFMRYEIRWEIPMLVPQEGVRR